MMKFLAQLFLLLLMVSCKKAEERSCLKSTGAFTELDLSVAPFNELNLGMRLNYTLVHDSLDFIRIKGGSNLVQSIHYEVIAGVLSIENKNRCNFLRSFAEIMEIEIHFTNLNRIEGRISHQLSALDTINGSFFNLELTGASGRADLLVNTNFLNGFVNDGNADYSFSGKTKFAHIQAHSNGLADVRELFVQEKLEITSRSTRAVFCKAEGIPLIVNIEATGDVYYSGTPSSITINKTGAGQLIHVD